MKPIAATQLWTDHPHSAAVFVESSGEWDEMIVLTMEGQPDGASVILDTNEAKELIEILRPWLLGYAA